MKIKVLIFSTISLFATGNSFAGTAQSMDLFKSFFAVSGNSLLYKCIDRDTYGDKDNPNKVSAIIGGSACSDRNNAGKCSSRMLLGRGISETGIEICGTVVAADRASAIKNPYTQYFGDDKSNCVWFCKAGYSGPNCEYTVTPEECDDTRYDMTKFGNGTSTGGTNVEDSVAMAIANHYEKYCGINNVGAYKTESDVVYGVKSFCGDGHGAIIRLYRVQSDGKQSAAHNGRVYIAEYGNVQMLVSANGYTCTAKYNREDATIASCTCDRATTCKASRQKKCNPSVTQGSGYNADDVEEFYYNPTGNKTACWRYQCKQEDYAFDDNYKCIECKAGAHQGIHPRTAKCVKCTSDGSYFNKQNGRCVSSTAYSKQDMMYGKGKTKNSKKGASVKDECWPLATPEEYKKCVIELKPAVG